MVKGKPWTVEMEKQLSELIADGKNTEVIAGILGKTVDSVCHKMRRLGLEVAKREEEGEATKILAPSSSSLDSTVDSAARRKRKDLPSIEGFLFPCRLP